MSTDDLRRSFGLQRLMPLLALGMFAVALWVLHHAAAKFHYHEIIGYVHAIPPADLFIAGCLTALSYLTLTGYDLLAISYLRQPLSRSRVMFAAFISYAFSNSIGLSVLAAGSIRYRLYSTWGVSAEQIAKLVGFTVVTFWVGIFTAGGLIFTFDPIVLPPILGFPISSVRPVGVLLLLTVVFYLFLLALRRTPFQLRSWEFSLPSFRIGLAQLLVGTLDWCFAGSVLFVLLPDQVTLSVWQFLGIYLLAQVIALISHVPGGLGVFESVILFFYPQASSALLGSLLLYRGIYYLLPLIVGTLLLAYNELLLSKKVVSRMSRFIGQWSSLVVPQLLTATTLFAGAVLLFSGATPAAPHRLHWLKDILPLPVVELSHFLGSLAGSALLLLARGIQRRLDASYILTLLVLTGGIAFSLFKGGDYEEAVFLGLLLLALLPCRQQFYRKSSLFSQRFTPGWVVTIVLIFASSLWLGLFAYKHVSYSAELWWQFALFDDAPRFMRAAVGAGCLLFIFSLAKLLKPSVRSMPQADPASLNKARSIVAASRTTDANLALLGDKALLFDETERGFVMYGVEKNSWISMGDPVGPDEIVRDLAWLFREHVEQHGGQPVFYEVGTDMLPVYLDMGLSLFKLGEQARVPLPDFTMQGKRRSGLRHTLSLLERQGCVFEVLPAAAVPELLPQLKHVSDSWLGGKSSREKGFSLGFFDANYLENFPLAVVRKEGKIVAFANLWTGAEKSELSIDLMRYLPGSAKGIMEYLFVQLILWGQEQGYAYFNLGMAPLSGLENRPFAPLWHRIGALVFRHGEHFYNFEGLRHYKDKFDPVWEPRYLACPGGLSLPRTLTNVATLISGGVRGVLSK